MLNINVLSFNESDCISLTVMFKAKDGGFFIYDWLRKSKYPKIYRRLEKIYTPSFNYGEFAIIKSHSELNNYKISIKEWVVKTKL